MKTGGNVFEVIILRAKVYPIFKFNIVKVHLIWREMYAKLRAHKQIQCNKYSAKPRLAQNNKVQLTIMYYEG